MLSASSITATWPLRGLGLLLALAVANCVKGVTVLTLSSVVPAAVASHDIMAESDSMDYLRSIWCTAVGCVGFQLDVIALLRITCAIVVTLAQAPLRSCPLCEF
jgi:hypothetical protein